MSRIAIYMISVLVLQQISTVFTASSLGFICCTVFTLIFCPHNILLKERCYRSLIPLAHSHIIQYFGLFTYLKMCRENGFQKGFGIL